MTGQVHVYGIRHHGPGSARSLLESLRELRPARLLVELPADTADAIPFAAARSIRPPVALLAMDKKAPGRSSFFPFAEWSPEWQAIRFALAEDIPIEAIDLPIGVRFREMQERESAEDVSSSPPEFVFRKDPLDELARVAGHSDGEAWWDAVVERSPSGPAVFEAIADAIGAAREHIESDESTTTDELNLRREAFMRKAVRAAVKNTEGDVAVVVGAWHVPALQAKIPATADRPLLTGLKPAKIECTWVPWTDDRLSFDSGYRAGISSPGWYRHLWNEAPSEDDPGGIERSTARWMTSVAQLLRKEGLAASTAGAIEASRLAIALASVRAHDRPGLHEMQDATLAALCHGDETPLALIHRRLIVGTSIGEVGDDVPSNPLAEDLSRQQKKLRLKPEALERKISVDLRTDSGLQKSILLHRLILLSVPWGELEEGTRQRGTAREQWTLQWEPELAVKLAEALRYGTTVADAAENAALDTPDRSLPALALRIDASLTAGLEQASAILIQRLQFAAANSSDLGAAMDAQTPLVQVLRYGTARSMPERALTELTRALAAQVLAGIEYACRRLDTEADRTLADRMRAFDRDLNLMEDEVLLTQWQARLESIGDDDDCSPFTLGAVLRILHERLDDPDASMFRFGRALSQQRPSEDSGAIVEGFLGDAAQLILHDEGVLLAIDRWISSLDDEQFQEALPMLRRAFSKFDAMERRRMMAAVSSPSLAAATGQGARRAASTVTLPDAFHEAAPLLFSLLGLDREVEE